MQFSRNSRLLSLAASFLAIHPAVYAQERTAVLPIEEIVVTSSRIQQPLRSIGTSMSVVSAEDIQAHGNLALTEVLRQLPAISINSNGGAGKPTSLRIRGEEGYRTLTVIDGLRLSDPAGTQVGPQLEHLLSSGIDRVEILRGPQGLSYGADAGGVINLSSRRVARGLQTAFDGQAGKYGTTQYNGSFAAGNTRGNLFLSWTKMDTDGFNAQTADTVLQDDDGYANTTFHAGGSVNLTDKVDLELTHRNVDGDSQFDGCFDVVTFAAEFHCTDVYGLQASRIALGFTGSNSRHTAAYSTTKTERENLSGGMTSFESEGQIKRFEYLGSTTALPGFDLVFGVDIEEAINNGIGRDNDGVFLEYLSDFSSNLFLTAGVRHDDNDDFGTNDSYRLSAAYLVDLGDTSTLKFKGSYGTGLRAPSPYEISYNKGAFSYPPAAGVSLRQEQSKGYEAGVEYWQDDVLRLEAVYFDQDVENAIYFDLDFFSGYLQDTGTSNSYGVELSADVNLTTDWQLTANYTYNPTERPNGQPRLRRPEQLMNIGVSYFAMAERLNINAFYRISRDSVDEADGTLVHLDDFEVLDISANFSINETLELFARVENALNEGYEEIAGYNTARRGAYVGFRMQYTGL